MEEKFKGIILKLIDYKDADKLASLFSLEQGVVLVKFPGVKREKAKFKAVAQPFVLAEFTAAKNGEHRTITSAEIIDEFSDLLNNYERTMCGYVVLDILKSILPEEKKEEELFLQTLNSLTNLKKENPYLVLIDFILKFISLNGLELQFVNSKYVYLDLITGNFTSERNQFTSEISPIVFDCLKQISMSKNLTELKFNEKILKMAVHLLHNVILLKFNEDIKSFKYI